MSSSLITRTVYKSLIKVARRMDATIINTPAAAANSVAAELTRFNLPFPVTANGSKKVTFTSVVREQFLAGKMATASSAPSASNLLNAALQSLALANQRAAALANPAVEEKSAATAAVSAAAPAQDQEQNEEGRDSKYTLGQVFRHSRLGYRAVIVGWDPVCRASEQWVAATGADKLPNGVHQPFYHCLVDVRDRPSAQISYVAEDLIEAFEPIAEQQQNNDSNEVVDTAAALQRFLVIHPLLTRYFSRFVPSNGQYVVRAEITEAGAGIGAAPVDVVMSASSSVVAAAASTSSSRHILQMGGSSSSSTVASASVSAGQVSDSDFEVGSTTDEDQDDDEDEEDEDDGTSAPGGRGTRNSTSRKPAASVSN